MRSISLKETLEARMAELLQDAATLAHPPRQTFDPLRDEHARAAAGAGDEAGPRIALSRTLGEGGMGVVHLGTQVVLGREVAVKTVKADARSDANTSQLLREAWITGALEHPNVVPVHDIAFDDAGRPRIVMKLIEGEPWSELFADASTVETRFKTRDLLDWNLRILLQVSDAIRFAHSRGFVHRDIKPENVMIGEFGEVYVVDWGLALSLASDDDGRLPLAKDATDMAGTPCYMAPEMLGGRGSVLGEHTDVYLLGATLFEIVTGRPPHDGETLPQVVASIVRTPPPIPESVPEELAGILRRALDAEPEARFESVEAFRLALLGFLDHRGSNILAEEAMERLHDLEIERSSLDVDPDELRLRLYAIHGECRFGFLEALRVWRENPVAKQGLARAATQMIELELSLGDVKAAEVHLLDVEAPSPSLLARIEEARRAHERERSEIASLRGELDLGTGRKTRLFVGMLLGVCWTIWPLFTAFRKQVLGLDPTHGQLMLGALSMLGLAGGLGYWSRESLGRTLVNRRIAGAVTLALVAQFVLYLGAKIMAIDTSTTHVVGIFLWAVIAGTVAMNVERRLAFAAFAYLAAFFVAALKRDWLEYAMSASNLALTLNVGLVWGRFEDVRGVIEPIRERRERQRRSLERVLRRRRRTREDRA